MTTCRRENSIRNWTRLTLFAAVTATGCGIAACAGSPDQKDGEQSLTAGSGLGSGALSMQQVLQYAQAAGVPYGPKLAMAGAIAAAESSLNPSESSTNGPTSGCPSGSVDRGLWQINSCYHSDVSNACAYNPACNAQAMAKISSDGSNWSPWSTYTSGAYKKYLSEAQMAMMGLSKDGGAGSDSGGGGAAGMGGSGGMGGAGGSGGGGMGGSAGMGGSGGGGGMGSSGGEDGGSGSSDGGGYAFFHPKHSDRHHAVALGAGETEIVPFTWHDSPGPAPAADLWVEADGKPVLQVASFGDRPFVRAGLDVAPLAADTTYLLELARSGDVITVSLVHDGDRVLVTTQVTSESVQAGLDVALADVVRPDTFFRATVRADTL